MKQRAAFYDLDGTLISGNAVTRYAFCARNHPSKARAALRYSKLVASVPLLIGLDMYSRRLFNRVFYREYRGLRKDWLQELSGRLFERVIRPAIYRGAQALVDADRAAGYRPVLVTGALDFDLGPVARYFGFHDIIANRLMFRNGTATGQLLPPLIAEEEKRAAVLRFCMKHNIDAGQSKAYGDSIADLPVLEAVGEPVAVHPDRRLRRQALQRGWPILDLKKGNHANLNPAEQAPRSKPATA